MKLSSKSSTHSSFLDKNGDNNLDREEESVDNNKSKMYRVWSYCYHKCLSIFSFKILILSLVFLLIYLFHQPLMSQFYTILYQYPPLASLFSEILREWNLKTLRGLLFIGFFSTLFIVSIPSELIFLQYINSGNSSIFFIIVILVIANTLAMLANYFIGLVIGRGLIKLWLKDKFYRYEYLINKWGGIILVIGNIVPSPIELISIIYGTSRYALIKYIYFVVISRTIRYSLLLCVFVFFPEYISIFNIG